MKKQMKGNQYLYIYTYHIYIYIYHVYVYTMPQENPMQSQRYFAEKYPISFGPNANDAQADTSYVLKEQGNAILEESQFTYYMFNRVVKARSTLVIHRSSSQ